uniref:Uncharacterized protein n=1 Tax=Myotis myotis TaxID=51298 RepID=A0A7J7Z559_MYOMY|nr:hypothetical protein mMyoMyo1_010599 [Myotis myotis]
MADFSLHSHGTSFAQWFFRKVYTDQEDRRRIGLAGGEGHPGSGNCSTQTQTAGARKRQPGKMLVHPKVSSVLLISPSFLHSGAGLPADSRGVWAAVEETRTRDTASGAHRGSGTRDFVGASLMPVCITLLMLPFE